MFTFQSKRKIGGLSEELSSEPAAKNRPFTGSVSNSELIQLLSGSTPDSPDSPNTGSSQNTSGVPAGLKAKYEQLSGVSMDDVSVHYNSDKPIQYGALAYTQGNDVYLGPGQEQHLSHELGHVIQQKQGRVPVTGSVGGAPLNDDPLLEHEADSLLSSNSPVQHITAGHHPDSGAPIQRLRINLSGDGAKQDETVHVYRYHKIPTGGERLNLVRCANTKESVKRRVLASKQTLDLTEDIVFEGHGTTDEHDETVVDSLQEFSPKELAEMAAKIPKPKDWKGKIILFGCSTGDIALQVAEEYYNLTGKSVTVVGPKEDIRILDNQFSLENSRIVFFDETREKEFYNSTFYTMYFGPLYWKTLINSGRERRRTLANLGYAHNLNLLHKELSKITEGSSSKNPSNNPISSISSPTLKKILSALNKIKTETQHIIETYPDNFWKWVPVKDELTCLYTILIPILEPNSSCTVSEAFALIEQAKQIGNTIWNTTLPLWELLVTTPLDFNDKTMITYATYPPPKDTIDPPTTKQSPRTTASVDSKFQNEAMKAYLPIITKLLIGTDAEENTSVESTHAGSTEQPSYVLDSKKRDEKLQSDLNFESFERLSLLLCVTVKPCLGEVALTLLDQKHNLEWKLKTALNLTGRCLKALNLHLEKINKTLPKDFGEKYPDLKTDSHSLYVALVQLYHQLGLYVLYNDFPSTESNNPTEEQQAHTLACLSVSAMELIQNITQAFFNDKEVQSLFTTPQPSDKKTTVSETDSSPKGATDPPAPKRSPQNDSTPPATKQSAQPTDTPKNLPNPLSSSTLFQAPKSPDLSK